MDAVSKESNELSIKRIALQNSSKMGLFVTNQVLIMTGIVKVAPFDC
jgi:hypothetical protein